MMSDHRTAVRQHASADVAPELFDQSTEDDA
ncbi:hypothetical protein C439_11388 [Haloferax mediterranei ATCC 33500]|uniref:Uncharacterized protein n=1 Tax=Haloferax mediterranei (strain ATCC 33500 / DSM 1411 / JCM 8866 / NBRC 14739 / NCIMB 2177 / R-4) TaxID=523841 RepID=M0IT77_HALMT|nr:hypothetical protein C439_11388 [Haloferax mediterranei ATCC 33500]